MFQDPISHLLACIRVCIKNKNTKLKFPNIKCCLPIIDILYQQGYIRGYHATSQHILIYFKLIHQQMFNTIFRISKPGNRRYSNVVVLRSFPKDSTYIISTTSGLLTHTQAITANRGGEIICVIK